MLVNIPASCQKFRDQGNYRKWLLSVVQEVQATEKISPEEKVPDRDHVHRGWLSFETKCSFVAVHTPVTRLTLYQLRKLDKNVRTRAGWRALTRPC